MKIVWSLKDCFCRMFIVTVCRTFVEIWQFRFRRHLATSKVNLVFLNCSNLDNTGVKSYVVYVLIVSKESWTNYGLFRNILVMFNCTSKEVLQDLKKHYEESKMERPSCSATSVHQLVLSAFGCSAVCIQTWS